MSEVPLINKEARLHRLQNQRRIAYSLIERSRTMLAPGTPFSRELHELFRAQGKYGSKDRRLYRELIYTYLRYLPWLDPIYRDTQKFIDVLLALAAPIQEVVDLYPSIAGPNKPSVDGKKRYQFIGRQDHELVELIPEWFPSHLSRPVSIRTILPIFTRPPLWLRIQTDPDGTLLQRIKSAQPPQIAEQLQLHPEIPDCVHAPADFKIVDHPAYQKGMIEIQDVSSQILVQLIHYPIQGKWLDACAGAGGKTLQLAKALQPFGKVHAYEPRPTAIRELQARVQRSNFRNVEVLNQRPTMGDYDGVLVDAPCSGSGTWRRHPYLMRQIREQDVHKHADKQLSILRTYAPLVKLGGQLIYCTCSLSKYENEEVARRFLEINTDFRQTPLESRFGLEDHGRGITVYPEDFNGDGLYIAAFKRID